jgi:hypothetical protein
MRDSDSETGVFRRWVFLAAWLLSAAVVLFNVNGMAARDDSQLAAVRRLGGVLWGYQNDDDHQLFAVRRADGFFGLVSINVGDDGIFLVLGLVGLVATGIAHLWHRRPLGPLLALVCFMAPQAIGLFRLLLVTPIFPGGAYEITIDPATGVVTTADGHTVKLCGITAGRVVQDSRWLDADVDDDGKLVAVDNFRRSDTAQALIDEVLRAVARAGCTGAHAP